MIEKGFSEEEIVEAINKLSEWKYLDDYSYATAYVKAKSQKYSKKKIFYGLLNQGVDKELIIRALEDIYSEEREFFNCLNLAIKIWNAEQRKWNGKLESKLKSKHISREMLLRKRLADKLLAKGFSPNTVKSVLLKIFAEEEF